MRLRGSLMGIAVVVALAGCTASSPRPPVVQPSAVKVAPTSVAHPVAHSTLSFCVGTSAKHRDGSVVTIHFMRGPIVLGEPILQVPMRVSAEVSPGPFSVVVDGVARMTGSAGPGQTVAGSMGQNCPA